MQAVSWNFFMMSFVTICEKKHFGNSRINQPDLNVNSFLYIFDYMADRFNHYFGHYSDPDTAFVFPPQ